MFKKAVKRIVLASVMIGGLFGILMANTTSSYAGMVHSAQACTSGSCSCQGPIWIYDADSGAYAAANGTDDAMNFNYGEGLNEEWEACEYTGTPTYWYIKSYQSGDWAGPNTNYSGNPATASASGPGNDEAFTPECESGHEWVFDWAENSNAGGQVSSSNHYLYNEWNGIGNWVATNMEAFDSNQNPLFC